MKDDRMNNSPVTSRHGESVMRFEISFSTFDLTASLTAVHHSLELMPLLLSRLFFLVGLLGPLSIRGELSPSNLRIHRLVDKEDFEEWSVTN
jgi:hypothetical protein